MSVRLFSSMVNLADLRSVVSAGFPSKSLLTRSGNEKLFLVVGSVSFLGAQSHFLESSFGMISCMRGDSEGGRGVFFSIFGGVTVGGGGLSLAPFVICFPSLLTILRSVISMSMSPSGAFRIRPYASSISSMSSL